MYILSSKYVALILGSTACGTRHCVLFEPHYVFFSSFTSVAVNYGVYVRIVERGNVLYM